MNLIGKLRMSYRKISVFGISLGCLLFLIGFLVDAFSDGALPGEPIMGVSILIFSVGVLIYILSSPDKSQ